MLKVRQTQMDVLQQQLAEKDLVRRTIEFLRIEYPEDIKRHPEGQWRNRVVNGISRARSYGITYESSIAAFVALMFQYAPNFDEYAPIHAILTDGEVPPDTRVKLLGECTIDEDWEIVEDRYDAAAWDVYFGD